MCKKNQEIGKEKNNDRRSQNTTKPSYGISIQINKCNRINSSEILYKWEFINDHGGIPNHWG